MQKWITGILLLFFIGFLSTPTIFAMNEKEVENFILAEEEEEENHKKNKSENNEEKIAPLSSKHSCSLFFPEQVFHLHITAHTLYDDTTVYILSPPPEHFFY